MRIRKNSKLSPLVYSRGDSSPLETTFQTHVCQLNQSPWDVFPFASDSNQFEAEDSFTENNGSHVDSIGPVESVASMMDMDEKGTPKIEDTFVKNNYSNMFDDNEEKSILSSRGEKEQKSFSCQKTDGKGWQCKKQAKPGQSFCDHHYTMLKSYNNNNNSSTSHQTKKSSAATVAATANARRARPRALLKKSSSSSNPYEFYYYSGFGPSWGRRRGDRREGNHKISEAKPAEYAPDNDDNATADVTTNANDSNRQSSSGSFYSSPSSQIDYVDDEEEEDSGKKRMRKPVKARSLKSLM